MAYASELPIDRGASANEMAQTIFGDGVTVVRASYTGDRDSSGIYTNGDSVTPGVTPGDTGVMFSTGDLRSFTNFWGQANQSGQTTSNSSGANGNSQFNQAAGSYTYDASYLDVDFIPTGNVMTMQFVFASEEYPEYQTSLYQDFVGVWINGQQVDMQIGDGDIDPNNLNAGTNQNLYVDNTGSQYNTEMDGFTVTMTLTIPVIPGQVNSIRIGIADVNDANYDSTLLIAGDSVQTTLVANTDTAEIYPSGTANIDVLANDINATGGSLTVTHINGVAVSAGDSVSLATGQMVTLNANGTLDVTGDGDIETVNFTYTVESSTGANDVGFVTVGSVPCFVAGSLIRTQTGRTPVEALRPGDMVLTKDNGLQPVRWVGRRVVAAEGDFAPIRIEAGTLGRHDTLLVSPLHRILVRDPMAHMLFGETEVLIAAKHLVNGQSICVAAGGTVEYVHVLFDRHEIISANGLDSESFLPGAQTETLFEEQVLSEICALFPELDTRTGEGYSPAARRILRGYEARLLQEGLAA
ncbi:2,3,4,5-tetrahydropyridine-2,6-carboxylate N-succinyltransferase [Thalassococcus profundi]|uniref:2,3,4,5-tetrahydropyridine-2,6-carboxylate N-succinyltransferase n=1 Tax=Thalassococcus profundi TaxID=2282382 RepID=A0A369TS29_9RHOB|nr:Hint domain-containing protein [Thalassococcus profundi]RDD67524.1 2,3,4,5-tetrahydropyridine-2,6-carboxylate N-succinyltransferase [Thalassococcus profundi]